MALLAACVQNIFSDSAEKGKRVVVTQYAPVHHKKKLQRVEHKSRAEISTRETRLAEIPVTIDLGALGTSPAKTDGRGEIRLDMKPYLPHFPRGYDWPILARPVFANTQYGNTGLCVLLT